MCVLKQNCLINGHCVSTINQSGMSVFLLFQRHMRDGRNSVTSGSASAHSQFRDGGTLTLAALRVADDMVSPLDDMTDSWQACPGQTSRATCVLVFLSVQ